MINNDIVNRNTTTYGVLVGPDTISLTDDPQAERGERTGRRALTPAQGVERGRDGGEVKVMTVTRA